MSGGKNIPGDAGNRGRAIRDLVAWARSKETAKALEALKLLDLSDADLEVIFQQAPSGVVCVPHLGRIG